MNKRLSQRAKKNLAILEEVRTAIALFGGFSLIFLTIPINKEPTITEKISLFISSSSSMLLLVCALFLAITSTVEKSNLEPVADLQYFFGEVDPIGYKVLVVLVSVSLVLFAISFILTAFRVHYCAGLGSIFAVLVAVLLGYFVTRKYGEYSD